MTRGEALSDYLYPRRIDYSWFSHPPVNLHGASYIAQVTVGKETVPMLIDTGSSDTWVVPSSFNCLDSEGMPTDQSRCGFPIFVEESFSGGAVQNEYLSIFYANKQYAYGQYGLESVSLGGVTIPNQQIALLSEGYIEVSSGDFAGILGLGYPAMVAGRKGDKPKQYVNNTDPMITYDTWFINAVKQNLMAPLFSMALDMDGGGLLAIGGIVDVPIYGEFAATPIRTVNLHNDSRAEKDFTYYNIIAQDYLINGVRWSELSAPSEKQSGRVFPVIIDSGFTTSPLPPSLVEHLYGAFDDAPQLLEIESQPMYALPCDTKAVPIFGVEIDNQRFEMYRETTLVARLNTTTANGTAFCALGVQPGIEEAGALGDTFLSDVVAVFDVGASEMRFAQRKFEWDADGRRVNARPEVKRERDEL
ncbi:unnamed protein product [Discula destructiva]